MKRFLVVGWTLIERATTVWCKGIVCDRCHLRFMCLTSQDSFLLIKDHYGITFNDTRLPWIDGIREDGCRCGQRIESIIEYLIAGENIPFPNDQWSHEWVFQGGCQCPQLTPWHINDRSRFEVLDKGLAVVRCSENCSLIEKCQTDWGKHRRYLTTLLGRSTI
jgi:hypothetical protein